MYDAIVVGARVAGSTTARLLAETGYRVLLEDKASFPSDTMSTLFLQPAAMVRLERWGLIEKVRASGCPAMREVRVQLDDVSLTGLAWSPDGVSEAFSPRRTVLDKILLDAAAAAGVEVREGFVFEDVVREGDRVVGIRGHAKGGASVSERARIVIGADGMRSDVARAVGATTLDDRPSPACWYYGFYSGVPVTRGEVVFAKYRSLSLWPTNDGLTIAIVGWPRAMYAEVKADLETEFLRAAEIAPEWAERLRGAKREERFYGTADVPFQIRRSHGPGWALVGDAGYHKDPCTAQGIGDGLAHAELLAGKIADGLAGRQDLDHATAAYQLERDARTRPVYDWTYRTAELKPLADKTRVLMQAVARSPEHTARFLGLIAGTVHHTDFFSPPNIAKILGAA
jgi:flavin-dependent dehydrogenase